jgi:hypothetical protein
MPAQRQLVVKLAMVDYQHPSVLDHKDCHREINFFVDMRHNHLTTR